MSEHFWEFMFKELATVPGKDKEFNRAPKSVKGTGKTARTPTQVVTQFSIISFNGIGLARRSRCFSRSLHALWRSVKLFVFAWNRRQLFKHEFPKALAHVRDFIYP